MNKNSIILLGLSALPCSAFAYKQCYLGVGLGETYIQGIDKQNIMDQAGISGTLSDISKEHVGGKLEVTCFNPNKSEGFDLGFGIGLFSFGDISTNYVPAGGSTITTEDKQRIVNQLWFPSNGGSIAMIPTYRTSNDFHLSAKIGAMRWHTKIVFAGERFYHSGAAFYYGADIKYLANDNYGLSLSWDASKYRNHTSNIFALNVIYQFTL